jgi:hypothetical protein
MAHLATLALLLQLALAPASTVSHRRVRGPFMKEEPMDVDPGAMVDDPSKLTDDQLHLSHGSLTPAKLDAMKKEMTTLQGSLATLMDKQSQLTTVYKMEKEREAEEAVTKKKVREEVARSLLKHLEQQSKSRVELMKGVVDKAVAKVKDEYQLDELNHPDHPEDATGGEQQGPDAAETGGATGGVGAVQR